MSTAIEQLTSIGANVFEPFTKQIAQILADMQTQISTLTQRVETLESGNSSPPKSKSTIKIPKSSKKQSKSTPVTPRSKRKKATDYRKSKKKDSEPEPAEPEPDPEPEQKDESKETDAETETVPSEVVKERGAEKNTKFSFQNDHNIIKVANNGSGAIKPKFKPGSIRFGKYVSKEDGNFAAYQITFDTKGMGPTPSGYAFGLATKGFNAYTSSNFGQNGSVMIKGNGQYITTDGMFVNEDKENYVHKQIIPMFREKGIFACGDDVILEIDLEDLTLKIWNGTRNDGTVFQVSIPNKPIVPIVYMGGSAKRKIIVSAQSAWKYKE